MTTNVPQVSFGPTGFIGPTEQQILAGVQADIAAAFAISGYNLNPALNTPQGQLASSEASIIGQSNDTFLYYTTQTDPAFSQGRMQDAIGRIYFMTRNPALPTVVQVVCSGAPNVNIPVGALIQDNAGNTYTATASGTIGSGGTVNIQFANLQTGPIAVPAAGTLKIYQAISGWDSVDVSSGLIGTDVESQSQFETRRAASVASNSVGSLPSIKGSVLAVPGVLDCYVTENTSSGTTTIGGVNLVPNSLYVAVSGGSASAVAQAIWSKKAPGCAYNGNTTVVVQDTSPGYSAPFPSYNVTFQIPFDLRIFFAVNIKNSTAVPSNAATQVQNALINAFAGDDGGSKASIGSVLYAARYVPDITSLGSWAQVISLQIGSANTPIASFTGSAGGTSLHVTALVSGTLGAGDFLVSGTAFSGTAAYAVGTTIVSQVSGTAGGVGFYTLSQPNTLPSQTASAVTANQNLVSVQINQEPSLDALDIGLTLT